MKTFAVGTQLNEFDTLGGFFDRVSRVPIVEKRPVAYLPHENDDTNWTVSDRHYGVMNAETHDLFTVVTNRYNLFQHREILVEVADTLREFDIEPRGRIWEGQHGRMHAKLYFQNPKYRFKPDEQAEDGEFIGLGLGLRNTYGEPAMALAAEAFGVDHSCANFNLWGEWLGREYAVHAGQVQPQIQNIVKRVVAGIPFMHARVRTAQAFQFEDLAAARAVLRALRIGAQGRKVIEDYAHEQPQGFDEVRPTAWQLYSALTAFSTHRGVAQDTQDAELRRWNRLINVTSLPKLVEQGHALLEADAKAGSAPVVAVVPPGPETA